MMYIQPGFHPFWFWNGPLDQDEISWQIDQMAAQGIRGFFIHPRQGMQVPYLSAAFFDLIRHAIDYAASLGLQVHLYDEFPYPSGAAGGLSLLGQPQHFATELQQGSVQLTGGPLQQNLPIGKVLACTAVPIVFGHEDWSAAIDLRPDVGVSFQTDTYQEVGLTSYNRRRYAAANPQPVLQTTLPDGTFTLYWSVQCLISNCKYFDHTPDLLSDDAIESYLSLTHDRYKDELGDRLGKQVGSIFIDESKPDWSGTLLDAYEAHYQEQLAPLLPALQATEHPRHKDIHRRLYELRYTLFYEGFEHRYQQRCRAMNLAYTGEKPSFRISQLAMMDLPGCDPGHVKVGRPLDILNGPLRQNARAVASVMWVYGKAGCVCECYHSTGWGATLQDAKYVADGLLLLGITHLVPHGFFASTHGLAKHDAPPTYFFQIPAWRHFIHLSHHVDHVLQHFQGDPVIDLIIIDPTPGMPTAQDLQDFEGLMQQCMASHRQFLLADLCMLNKAQIRDGSLHFEHLDGSVPIVVLPPMQDPEPGLMQYVETFRQAGGAVFTSTQWEQVLAASTPALEISGPGCEAVWLGSRKITDSKEESTTHRHFLLNQGSSELNVTIHAPCKEVRQQNTQAPLLHSDEHGYHCRLPAGGSCLVEETTATELQDVYDDLHIDLSGPCRLQRQRSNLLRLDNWSLQMYDLKDQLINSVEKVQALPLAELIDGHGLLIRPMQQRAFLTEPQLCLPPVQLHYHCSIENHHATSMPCRLLAEPGSLIGEWRMRVNHGQWIEAADLKAVEDHIRGSLGHDVLLSPGTNTITVHLTTNQLHGGLVNPLYLAGEFAVCTAGSAITTWSDTGTFSSLVDNGMPFYAGEVDYIFTSEQHHHASHSTDQVCIHLQQAEAWDDAAEIRFNNGAWHPVPWAPRQLCINKSELQKGNNTVTLRVAHTLLGCFEAKRFDHQTHQNRALFD